MNNLKFSLFRKEEVYRELVYIFLNYLDLTTKNLKLIIANKEVLME